MAISTDKALSALAEKIPTVRDLEPSERHVNLLWLITRGVNLIEAERPIMVGGGAVDLFTSIHIATGDLDLVVPDRPAVEFVLDALGFVKPESSSLFIHREAGLLVDLHKDKLFDGEETVELVYKKVPLRVISPEDCIVNRLDGYLKKNATLELISAFLISLQHRERLDFDRLQKRVEQNGLADSYRFISDLGRRVVIEEAGVDEIAKALFNYLNTGEAPECAF